MDQWNIISPSQLVMDLQPGTDEVQRRFDYAQRLMQQTARTELGTYHKKEWMLLIVVAVRCILALDVHEGDQRQRALVRVRGQLWMLAVTK